MARKLKVQFERASGGDRGEAFVRDASLGGLFIETEIPFENGTLVAIEIASPSGAKIVVDARVISVQLSDHGPERPAGMAVRFLDLPDGAAGTLGPMFQQTRPPARTFLGVGSTETEIPKAPSVPRVVAPRPVMSGKPVPSTRPEPASTAAAATAPERKVTTPTLAVSPFAPPPGAPPAASPPAVAAPPPMSTQHAFPPPPAAGRGSHVSPPPAAAFAQPRAAMPAQRGSPLVWIVVAAFLAVAIVTGVASAVYLLRSRPVSAPRGSVAP